MAIQSLNRKFQLQCINVTSIKLVSAVLRPRLTLCFFFLAERARRVAAAASAAAPAAAAAAAVAAAVARSSVAAAKIFEDF